DDAASATGSGPAMLKAVGICSHGRDRLVLRHVLPTLVPEVSTSVCTYVSPLFRATTQPYNEPLAGGAFAAPLPEKKKPFAVASSQSATCCASLGDKLAGSTGMTVQLSPS